MDVVSGNEKIRKNKQTKSLLVQWAYMKKTKTEIQRQTPVILNTRKRQDDRDFHPSLSYRGGGLFNSTKLSQWQQHINKMYVCSCYTVGIVHSDEMFGAWGEKGVSRTKCPSREKGCSRSIIKQSLNIFR